MSSYLVIRGSARSLVALVVVSCIVASAGVRSGPPVDRVPDVVPDRIGESALRQMALLTERKRNLTTIERKIGSNLLLARDRLRGVLPPELDSVAATVPMAKGGRSLPLVDIGFEAANFATVLKALDDVPNVEIVVALPAGVRAAVAFDSLERVATIDEVLWVSEAAEAMTWGSPTPRAARAANVRTRLAPLLAAHEASAREVIGRAPEIVNVSQGDVAHRANTGRTFFGASGAGVKIGVLSDSVDGLAAVQASGDLGPVTVLPGQSGVPGTGEGTAMLEIVHDLAPNAQLYFASAFASSAQFAQNIRDLRAAGCDVIVDDVIYFDEAPFQDGGNTPITLIADAVREVTAAGALYFSSAGNQGNLNDNTSGVWEGMFTPSTSPAPGGAIGTPHTFGGAATNTFDTVSVASGRPAVLTWDNPIGTASDDYDIFVLNSGLTSVLTSSTNVQDGVGGNDFPVEITPDAPATNNRLVVTLHSGSARFIRVQVLRARLAIATSGATFGHSTVANAYGVAAVDVATAIGGAFVGGASSPAETFTADGPRRLFRQADGSPFPGGFVDRQKPDLAAADGVSCATPGFNLFFGTSAAAPHAAAIAALVKSANASLTPAQIRTALTSSALDIEASGVDRDTGAGIVMAFDALQASGAAPIPFLALQSSTPFEVSGNGSGFFDPCEEVGFTVALRNDGGAAATNISATLTTGTPGIAIVSGTSTYPDVAAGAAVTNSQPLTVLVGSTVACGTFTSLTLMVSYGSSGQTTTVPLTLRIGRPGGSTTVTFTGTPVGIPDGLGAENPGATVMAPLVVSGVGILSDVDFRFNGTSCNATSGSTTVGLDHTFVGDLRLQLRSPSGTTINLVDRMTNGGGGNSGNNFCNTVLDDEATSLVQALLAANAPFTGSFKPANALSTFDGENADGTWQLLATDFFVGDIGNIRSFSLTITSTVCDPVPVTVACPAPVTVPAGAGQCSAVVNYTPPSSAGCATVTCVPASGSTFGVGTTPVTCTASDGAGGTAMCTFPVTVTDTTPPTVTCPASVTQATDVGQCAAVVSYTTPTAIDACTGATVVCSPASGSAFPIGTTTVSCTATDGAGNAGTCSFTVTVADTQPPTIACPANVTAQANTTQGTQSGALVAYPSPTVSDLCPGVGAPICAPASGSFFPVGTTTVTCTVTDAAANSASCSFTVTVTPGFTNCYVDDATADTLSIVADPTSPLYRLWQYRVAATGQVLQGQAEYLVNYPGRSLTAYDHDSATMRMDLTVNIGSATATATVTQLAGNVRRVLRDRNITNDPPCQ